MMAVNSYDDLVSQAHRLLRVKWENPAALAEELYSMIMPAVGTEMPGDTEIPDESPAAGEVARRLEEARNFFSSLDLSSSVENIKATFNPPPETPFVTRPLELPAPRATPEEIPSRPIEVPNFPLPNQPFLTTPFSPAPPFVQPIPTPPLPFAAPPIVPGPPLAYSRPDLPIPKLPDLDWDGHIDSIPFGSGGAGGIIGLITGGSGDTYTADLYENGKNSAVTRPGVTVFIPQIADGQDIPNGTWIAPVIEVTSDAGNDEFWYQPPIWLG